MKPYALTLARWLPHDPDTWSFVLSVAALTLALPIGIASTLLAPKLQVWWFLRSVKGTANKLISLTEYRKQLEKEPLFSPTETLIFEQQVRASVASHSLAYLVILAVVLTPKVHPHTGFMENVHDTLPVIPFVVLLFISCIYSVFPAFITLRRSSPKERKKLEKQIDRLVEKLRNKMPPPK